VNCLSQITYLYKTENIKGETKRRIGKGKTTPGFSANLLLENDHKCTAALTLIVLMWRIG